MKQVLAEIQDGTFAKKWLLENQVNRPQFNALRRKAAEHPIEQVGAQLRGMMSWMKKNAWLILPRKNSIRAIQAGCTADLLPYFWMR
jgi:hypothetical protein